MKRLAAVGILGLGFLSLWALRDAPPLWRLAAATLGMLWLIKLAALTWQSADGVTLPSPVPTLGFLFLWPGVSTEGFTRRGPEHGGARFLESWLTFLAGCGLLLVASWFGQGDALAFNYAGLFAILLIVHLGLVEVAADAWRLLGFQPRSLFVRPYLAESLRDFWSRRWNLAFVDMDKIFFLQPLRGKIPRPLLGFLIFAISGLLHELGISYADGVSWGKPLLYFCIQGLGMEWERHRRWPRPLVWLWILLPLPLLFTPAFTTLFVGMLEKHLSLALRDLDLVRTGLIAGGLLHFLVLCASVQVPGKLGWKEDFAKLRTLNRKTVWTYGAYIFTIILFFGLASLAFASQPASLALRLWTIFIALFWWARVCIDLFYMKHEDWPQGPLFKIGHICLTTLFVTLSVLYSLVSLRIQT